MAKNDDRNNTAARAANGAAGGLRCEARSLPGAGRPRPRPELAPVDKPRRSHRQGRARSRRSSSRKTHRLLDSWEKYRALTDTLDEAVELVDLGDHKARFALIIAGALNVFLFALGASTDVFDNIPSPFRLPVATLAGLYAVLAIYVLVQAIESLRPRRAQPYVHYSADTGGYEEYPLGLRFTRTS